MAASRGRVLERLRARLSFFEAAPCFRTVRHVLIALIAPPSTVVQLTLNPMFESTVGTSANSFTTKQGSGILVHGMELPSAPGRTARGISWTASSCVWRSPRDRSERRVRSCYRRFRASRKKICRNAYANSLTLAPRALFGCESAEGTTLLDVLAAVVRA